jgi:putative Holliday junction resolvase
MRYVAVDLGDRRTGLAVGDSTTGIVTPVGVLEVPRGTQLDAAVDTAIEEHDPDAIVVGLPVNMDGTEGDRAKIARVFGAALQERTGRPVEYQDERLTSFSAEQTLARSGRTHKQKKQIRDALAAAEILRDFLEAR